MNDIDYDFIDRLNFAIGEDELIPIIGDTMRDEDIFDVDDDDRLEIARDGSKPLWKKTDFSEIEWNHFNITEKLSALWAKQINYPMLDGYKMERVSLFQTIRKKGPKFANVEYQRFRKSWFLKVAKNVAAVENDEETLVLIEEIENRQKSSKGEPILDWITFSDLVVELDFPRYEEGYKDPIHVLAKLPLSHYVTTDQHDFLERALKRKNKRPKTRLFWPPGKPGLLPEHKIKEGYEPSEDEPIVYHLCGHEAYPESLVVSEDSYLDLLIRLKEDDPGDGGNTTLPLYLQDKVKRSSLLLLGYRFQDWDFRVVFRSMLQIQQDSVQKIRSFAVQLDLSTNSQMKNREGEVRDYLETYFDNSQFDLHLGPVNDILEHLQY